MELITPEDVQEKYYDLFQKLSKGDRMWVNEEKLLLKAQLEVIINKINELVCFANRN